MNIFSIKGFEKMFQSLEKHFLVADTRDVRDALEITKERQTGGLSTVSKDREMRVKHSMPQSWWFHPAFSSKIDVNKLDKKEYEAMWKAFGRVFPKFDYKYKGRWA